MHDYHELINVENVSSADELSIPRAAAIANAVENNRHTQVINLHRYRDEKNGVFEYVVIEIECDGVPSKNPSGIEYRERLALVISDDPGHLVEVWALRKSFPLMMHQYGSPPGTPISLCLYFELVSSVLRTWTPQKFIRRIKWWLESSAKGVLHPSEQPVEQLYFASKYELVFPWDYETIRGESGVEFAVYRGEVRSDNGCSFFVQKLDGDTAERNVHAELMDIDLPPVIHGHIERDPNTLGALYAQLKDRGIDLLHILGDLYQCRVGEKGLPKSQDTTFTIFVLHIPIARAEGMEPEGVMHRSFVLCQGFLKIGEAIGALLPPGDVDGIYYVDHLGSLKVEPEAAWHTEQLYVMEVQQLNDRERARSQSGIKDEGPEAVLVGAGSLGSAMLELWVRSGWGKWTVIDNDHIKPHNLSRHVAHTQHIGMLKSDVATQLQYAIAADANPVKSICADACNTAEERVNEALQAASVVIDASTSLEYPRLASTRDDLPRHLSTFITPNGNSAVLLGEDSQRSIRLRTLEAQYYRALINNSWGEEHLGLSPATFWSGASCRDISFKLAYSKILTHAGNLVEHIQSAVHRQEPFIGVWSRQPDTGSVELHCVETHAENTYQLGDYRIFIDDGIITKLRDLRGENEPNETGGVLLGYYDLNINTVVVVDGFSAPTDSRASRTGFERGTDGLENAIKEASNRTAGMVGYIGEWHSHPDGYSVQPSRDDLIQLAELTMGMDEDGLPGVVMIVGDEEVNIIQGVVGE